MEQFSFNVNNSVARYGVCSSLQRLYCQKMPVIVCIGTDGVAGDSLGPFVGTILKQRNIPAFIYGYLDSPITAYEVPSLGEFLKKTHPDTAVLVIDSAVGKQDDIGVIKITDSTDCLEKRVQGLDLCQKCLMIRDRQFLKIYL